MHQVGMSSRDRAFGGCVKITAFDLSLTSTGYACNQALPEGFPGVIQSLQPVQYGRLFPEGQGYGMRRIDWIRDRVLTLANESALVVIEDLANQSRDGKALERAGLSYIIRYGLYKREIPFVMVPPISLKKFVVGFGGSKKNPVLKEHVMLNLFKRFGYDIEQNDAADAVGLIHIGLALKGLWDPQLDAQREVLAKLR